MAQDHRHTQRNEAKKIVVARVAQGSSIASAAKSASVSPSTVSRWRKTDKPFDRQLREAINNYRSAAGNSEWANTAAHHPEDRLGASALGIDNAAPECPTDDDLTECHVMLLERAEHEGVTHKYAMTDIAAEIRELVEVNTGQIQPYTGYAEIDECLADGIHWSAVGGGPYTADYAAKQRDYWRKVIATWERDITDPELLAKLESYLPRYAEKRKILIDAADMLCRGYDGYIARKADQPDS